MLPIVWFLISLLGFGWCFYLFGPLGAAIESTIALLIVLPLAYYNIYVR